MLHFEHSMFVAQQVINHMLNDRRSVRIEAAIEAYQNGREQGHLVWCQDPMNITFYISEDRHSDDIVVYVGRYSMQSISDDAYTHKNSFKPGCYQEASNFIYEYLGFEKGD
jgi:hypothetical protein